MNQIRLPSKAGETIQFGNGTTVLEVTKLRKDYFAKVIGTVQGRFGDASQIRADIEYFLKGGNLPKARRSFT